MRETGPTPRPAPILPPPYLEWPPRAPATAPPCAYSAGGTLGGKSAENLRQHSISPPPLTQSNTFLDFFFHSFSWVGGGFLDATIFLNPSINSPFSQQKLDLNLKKKKKERKKERKKEKKDYKKAQLIELCPRGQQLFTPTSGSKLLTHLCDSILTQFHPQGQLHATAGGWLPQRQLFQHFLAVVVVVVVVVVVLFSFIKPIAWIGHPPAGT